MDLTARIGANTAGLRTGLQDARAQVKKAAGDMSTELGKVGKSKFGLGVMAGAMMAQLGISIEGIATKLAAAIMGGTAEGFAEVERMTRELDARRERKMLDGMSADGRVAYRERELAAAKEAYDPSRKKWGEDMQDAWWSWTPLFQAMRKVRNESEEDWQRRRLEQQKRIADAEDRLAEEKKRRDEGLQKTTDEQSKAVQQFIDEAKNWSEQLRAARLKEMTPEQRAQVFAADAEAARRQAREQLRSAMGPDASGSAEVADGILETLTAQAAQGGDWETTQQKLAALGVSADVATSVLQLLADAARRERAAKDELQAAAEAAAAAKQKADEEAAKALAAQRAELLQLANSPAERLAALTAFAREDAAAGQDRGGAAAIADYYAELVRAGAGFEFDSLRQIGGSIAGANYNVDPEAERQTTLMEQMTELLRRVERNTDPKAKTLGGGRYGSRPGSA